MGRQVGVATDKRIVDPYLWCANKVNHNLKVILRDETYGEELTLKINPNVVATMSSIGIVEYS